MWQVVAAPGRLQSTAVAVFVAGHSLASKEFPSDCGLERDLRVTQSLETVNPMGNPISHSTHKGLNLEPSNILLTEWTCSPKFPLPLSVNAALSS